MVRPTHDQEPPLDCVTPRHNEAQLAPERLPELLRVFADPVRLRILGLVAGGERSLTQLADALGLSAASISHHLDKLEQSSLIVVHLVGQRRLYALDEQTLQAIARTARESESSGTTEDLADQESAAHAKIRRDFFEGERLKQIPAQRKKLLIVLEILQGRFEPDRDYPEREVNDALRSAHEDVATLRRDLVDFGFMSRSGGIYRVVEAETGLGDPGV